MIDLIKNQIEESVRITSNILSDVSLLGAIDEVVRQFVSALRSGHKVMWAGNGGSAADAQHMAAELVNKFRLERPGMASIALTTDTSILTSIGNDYGYDRVFARQLEALGAEGDVFIGISTSGNSENLVQALGICRERGVKAVALVGGKPCRMDAYDLVIHVPSQDTPRIQECQTLIGHILCELTEKSLYGNCNY